MAAGVILVTEVVPLEGQSGTLASALCATPTVPGVLGRQVYQGVEGPEVVELVALSSLDALVGLAATWEARDAALAPLLASDWRRQVLRFVEAVKPCEQPLPDTAYLQLRHVEVRPPQYAAYRAWREQTIFGVVRRSADVEIFLAYHSQLSEKPGVMFLSGFSVEPDKYQQTFKTEEYRKIVQDAADTFITGGKEGLYTKIYRRVEA